MEIVDYIKNRNKIQFASDLAFGKIAKGGTANLSVPARGGVGSPSNTVTTENHGLTGTPLVMGWCSVDGGNWLNIEEILVIPGTTNMTIYAFANPTQVGFMFKNNTTSSHTALVKYWLVIV